MEVSLQNQNQNDTLKQEVVYALQNDAGLGRPSRDSKSSFSASFSASSSSLVIDAGSWRTRLGLVSSSPPPPPSYCEPATSLRSLVMKCKAKPDGLLALKQGFKAGDTVRIVGDYDPHTATHTYGADMPRGVLRSPFEAGCTVNHDVLETILDTALYATNLGDEAAFHAQNVPIAVSQCIAQPAALTATTAEMCFERYAASTFLPWHDAAMAFRHTATAEDGIAVMLGHSTSHVLPVLGGKPVYAAAVRVEVAGLRMSEYLLNVLCLRNPQHAAAMRWGLPLRRAEECKHMLCGVCPEIDYSAFLGRIASQASEDEKAAHESREKHTRYLQLPWEDAMANYHLAVADYEERKKSFEALKERRREAGQRMREMAAAKRAEKEARLRVEAARLASYLTRVEEVEASFAGELAEAEKLVAEQLAAENEAAAAAAAAERKAKREAAKAAKAAAAAAAAAAATSTEAGATQADGAAADTPKPEENLPAKRRRIAKKPMDATEDEPTPAPAATDGAVAATAAAAAPVATALVAAVEAKRDAALAELMADISAEEISQRIAAGVNAAAASASNATEILFPTPHHLRRRIAEVENDIRKLNGRTDLLPLPPLPPKVYPLADVPDDQLDAAGLKEKRKQRLQKANEEYRRKLDEKKKRKKEKEEAKIAKMDAEFAEDPEKHIADLHARRNTLLESQRKRLGSRATGGAADAPTVTVGTERTATGRSRRGTGEDRERMRLVAQAAFDPDSGRGRGGGNKDKKMARKREAAFGVKDSDWDVYAKMDRSGGGGGGEEEDEVATAEAAELAFIEDRLRTLDGGFMGGGGGGGGGNGVASPPDPLGEPPMMPRAEHYQVPLLTERYSVGELLFTPSICGEHGSGGLQDAILSSLRRLPGGANGPAATRVCKGGLIISGGLSLLPGVRDRVQAEMVARMEPGRAPSVSTPVDYSDSLHGAWRGMASYMRECTGGSGAPQWQAGKGAAWLTRAEYEEHGADRGVALLTRRFLGATTL